jgi:hypothetical protein
MAKSISGLCVAALCGLGLAIAGTPASAQPDSIVGSWVVIPSAPNRPPGLPNVFTFTSDGTIIRFSPADRGATGAWIDSGNRTVTYTFVALNRGAAGDFVGTFKVRGKVTLNPAYDEFTGGGKVDFFDPQGKLTQSGEFTTHATRVQVESP